MKSQSTNRLSFQFIRTTITMVIVVTSLFSAGMLQAAETEEDKKVDKSIERALVYLSKYQQKSGAWRVDSYGESTASTSLAIMSYLAAGYVPGEGEYGKKINKGIEYVLNHQHDNGMLVSRKSHGPMYSHGISTLMLAEVVGMVDKQLAKKCRKGLEESVKLILKSQNVAKSRRNKGGWRYQATSTDSDLSVTGWQLLALRAAKDAGCDVPKKNIDNAVQYVTNCAHPTRGGFGYQPRGSPTATRTGTGILALEICGQHKSDAAIVGADYLLDNPLSQREHYFFYGVYYCTVGMFKVGGKYWDATKKHNVKLLLAMQNQDGSWRARQGGERAIGTVYCTSLAVLALAVEYRYLPIYQR